MSKTTEELSNIAAELSVKYSSNMPTEELVYEILDAQALNQAEKAIDKPAKRRTRIVKQTADKNYASDKPRADHIRKEVPSNNITAASNIETMPLLTDTAQDKEEINATTFAQTEIEPQEPTPIKKKRGRPSKAELEARKAAEEAKQASVSDEKEDTSENLNPTPVVIEETNEEPESVATTTDYSTIENSNERKPVIPSNSNGQDFIILQDIPVIREDDFIVNETLGTSPKLRKLKDETNTTSSQQEFESQAANLPKITETGIRQKTDANTTAAYDALNTMLTGMGVLEITNEGCGFLRSSDYNYLPSPDDIYVTQNQIKNYGLKAGDVIEGSIKVPREGEKFFALITPTKVNGLELSKIRDRVAFEHLTPLFPEEKFTLCSGRGDSLSRRVVDLFAPIGKGQRALIVAQPKTGKTLLMKDIANAIAEHHPEAYLMMLLIDERPEEVTDMARTVNAEVIASTFDEPAANHVKIAGIVLEKAKRMVECGHDVVIFLDSITRLARAYNTVAPGSGKILSGGVDSNALQKPKRFFGAARNIEGGGSLTIIATALIDTGSKMDEVIFEEFKGTGNMELQLDRALSNKRIYPAVNLVASSTRRDELLQDENTIRRMWVLRNYIAEMTPIEAMTDVKKRLEQTINNEEFLVAINS